MPYIDLHDEPFDDGTIAKLEIFEDYAQAWLPTWIMQGSAIQHICVFDFFAGTGYDKNGVAGSPIRLLRKIKEQVGYIHQKKVKITLHLNEFEPKKTEQKKFALLQGACNEFLDQHPDVKRVIDIEYHNLDFEKLFPTLLSKIQKFPSLVYLDQNGIKFLSEKYFMELERTEQTDFLYFLSASYVWRFGDSKEFKLHLDIDLDEAKKRPYRFIHRSIIEQLRRKLPAGSKLKLYPYSIKKGANIHGIIFGAKHPRAVDKFLTVAWGRNELNGQANFDIEEEIGYQQDLFAPVKLNKIQAFQQMVRDKILAGEIRTNKDLLNLVHDEGHIGSHAADCVKEMKRKKEINYDGNSPLVTYENVYKKRRLLDYTKLNK